eukprot:NODE_190_length_13461_cov_0.525595.p11 type:complete len:117 gc:universal NODE_190_length_13461_cov_0.525595:3038-3388(+)
MLYKYRTRSFFIDLGCYWDETRIGTRKIEYLNDIDGKILRDTLRQEVADGNCAIENKGDWRGDDAPGKCDTLNSKVGNIKHQRNNYLGAIIPGAILGFFSIIADIWMLAALCTEAY